MQPIAQQTVLFAMLVASVILVAQVEGRPTAEFDDAFQRLMLRSYLQPYGADGRAMSAYAPRVTRNDYQPTPCRWKLCASYY